MDVDDIPASALPPPGTTLIEHHSAASQRAGGDDDEAESRTCTPRRFSRRSAAPPALPSSSGGISIVRSVLAEGGIPSTRGYIQVDGSGLSRYDYVTADTMVAALAHVDGDPQLRERFRSALPAAGRDGTLANRMKGTAAEGAVRAKSGSMTGARALAGYATDADGEALAFAVIANNFGASSEAARRR